MNPRVKLFLLIVLIVVILVLSQVFLTSIEYAPLNFFIRSMLIIFVIYLILEVMKYIKK